MAIEVIDTFVFSHMAALLSEVTDAFNAGLMLDIPSQYMHDSPPSKTKLTPRFASREFCPFFGKKSNFFWSWLFSCVIYTKD